MKMAVIISNQGKSLDVYYEIRDRLIDIFDAMEPTRPNTAYLTARKFSRYIDGVLLNYEDPETREISINPYSRSVNVTIMTLHGFFNFVAYKNLEDDYKFDSSYVTHFNVIDYYKRIQTDNLIETVNNLTPTKSIEADFLDAWTMTSEKVDTLHKIRLLLHDRRATWGIKAVAAYRTYFPDHPSDVIRNKSHPKDRYKVNDYTYELNHWIFDNTYNCDCSVSEDFRNDDFGQINESIRFIFDTGKLTWNAKGILAYLIFHKFKNVTTDEIHLFARNKYNSTPKGMKDLTDHGYVSEDSSGILRITDEMYSATKKFRTNYDKFVQNVLESQERFRKSKIQ